MFKIKSKKMAVHKKYNNGTKSNALGRGLDALISTEGVRTQGSSTINEIPLDQIEANPNQPRREFDDEALHELAESIKAIGIIQPITLRQVSENRFQIIAGERRWRASQLAGLTAIPAYIRTISDENVMEMALVENIQRQDLNAIEIALAYEHLLAVQLSPTICDCSNFLPRCRWHYRRKKSTWVIAVPYWPSTHLRCKSSCSRRYRRTATQ